MSLIASGYLTYPRATYLTRFWELTSLSGAPRVATGKAPLTHCFLRGETLSLDAAPELANHAPEVVETVTNVATSSDPADGSVTHPVG